MPKKSIIDYNKYYDTVFNKKKSKKLPLNKVFDMKKQKPTKQKKPTKPKKNKKKNKY